MTLLWWVATAKSNRHAANIALAVAFSLALAASPSYAELARQDRAVASIDRVVLRAAGELEIMQGSEESLVVETEPRLLPEVDATVDHGTLTIDLKADNIRTREPLRYVLHVKRLEAIEIAGSGKIHVKHSPQTDSVSSWQAAAASRSTG